MRAETCNSLPQPYRLIPKTMPHQMYDPNDDGEPMAIDPRIEHSFTELRIYVVRLVVVAQMVDC